MKSSSEMAKIFIFVCFFVETLRFGRADEVVTIEYGEVKGVNNGTFYSFKGIPYAKAPIGELRFASPQKYTDKWSEPWNAENFSPVCAQFNHFSYKYEGDEDCLFLNVYVPAGNDGKIKKSKTKKKLRKKSEGTGLPVIFFIHGGAFSYGSGEFYGPDNLMKANVILVTINYRLGVLGFLSSEDDVIPGNFGLKDQVAALQWVKRNIGAFGGDPEKVTITGFSAGGASVHLHMMSPMSKGLFKNGISHSGAALNPWVMQENAIGKTKDLAEVAGCEFDDKVLDCLREKPADELVEFIKKYQGYLYNPFSPLGLVVEKGDHSDKFLDEHPREIINSGKVRNSPWLLSMTRDEGLYPAAEFYEDDHLAKIDSEWKTICPFLIDINSLSLSAEEKDEVCVKVRENYFGDKTINKDSFSELRKLMTDRLFHHGAYKTLTTQKSPMYFYHFRMYTKNFLPVGPWWHHRRLSNESRRSMKNEKTDEVPPISDNYLGVAHGDDTFLIYYFWASRGPNPVPYTEDEQGASDNFLELYKSFNKKGVPTLGSVSIPMVKPHTSKKNEHTVDGLEISSSKKYNVIQFSESFGNANFWDSLNLPE